MGLFRKGHRRRKRASVMACARCGSRDFDRPLYFEGPITYEHRSDQLVVCNNCGHEGVPLAFQSEEERERYAGEVGGETQKDE